MKVTKVITRETKISFPYPLHPENGNGTLTANEWENGEGWDVKMADVSFEMTYCELAAMAKLFTEINITPLLDK